MRVLWMATELGIPFQHVPLGHDDPVLKSPGYLRINPAGAIPTIVDDGFALAESLAINLFLAKKYGDGASSLYPSDTESEAQVWRWSLWAQRHLEPWIQRDRLHEELRKAVGDRGGLSATHSPSPISTLRRCFLRRARCISTLPAAP